jgi:glycosyltransferase involved in cell wall biosynthesis
MRILIVSAFVEPHLGGVEHFVSWLERRLRRSGHEVRVLAVDHPGGARADVLVPARFVGEEMPVVLPTPAVLRALRREVRWADAVLIQQLGHTLSFLAGVVARLQRTPARTVFHGAGPAVHVSRGRELLTDAYELSAARLLSRLARPLVQTSAGQRYTRSRYGARADRFPYPVQALPARVALPPPARDEALRVVFAARMIGEKAPLDAIAACESALAAGPLRLDLYGEGPLLGQVREAAARRPWVRVHGRIPWPALIEEQRGAHVFLSSSVEDNVQVSLLEALAMGLPAVATRVGEAPSYLAGELAALCVEPRRPDLLGGALRALRADYEAWQRRFAANAGRLRAAHSESASEAAILAAIGVPRAERVAA